MQAGHRHGTVEVEMNVTPSRDCWRDRFHAWSDTKTQRALSAHLSPYETDLEQPGRDARAIGNTWTMRLFDGPFYVAPPSETRPSCSLVFVQSADGNTGADDPGTLGG